MIDLLIDVDYLVAAGPKPVSDINSTRTSSLVTPAADAVAVATVSMPTTSTADVTGETSGDEEPTSSPLRSEPASSPTVYPEHVVQAYVSLDVTR